MIATLLLLKKLRSQKWTSDFKEGVQQLQSIIEDQELVRHMWVHDGYSKNGYRQMTTDQKKRYCEIIGATFDPENPIFK